MSGNLLKYKKWGGGEGGGGVGLEVTWDVMVFHPDGGVVFESLDASEPAVSKT